MVNPMNKGVSGMSWDNNDKPVYPKKTDSQEKYQVIFQQLNHPKPIPPSKVRIYSQTADGYLEIRPYLETVVEENEKQPVSER